MHKNGQVRQPVVFNYKLRYLSHFICRGLRIATVPADAVAVDFPAVVCVHHAFCG